MDCQLATLLKRSVVQVGPSSVTDTSTNQNNNMKSLATADGYVIWPERPEFSRVGPYFSRGKKSGEFEEKVRLAHDERLPQLRNTTVAGCCWIYVQVCECLYML